jgi:hypothetical protein
VIAYHDVPIGERLVSDISESRPLHRVLDGGLLRERGDGITLAAAQENGSAQKAAAWLKTAVTFRHPVFIDSLEKDSRDPRFRRRLPKSSTTSWARIKSDARIGAGDSPRRETRHRKLRPAHPTNNLETAGKEKS